MNRSMVTGTCPQCKCEIKPANNQGQFNRNLGWHMLKAHGKRGQTSTPEGKRALARARHWRISGLSPKEIEAREARFLQAHPNGASVVRKKKPGEAIHMGLDQCPKCGLNFLSREGGASATKKMKLNYCPRETCGIHFYYTEP